MWKLIKKLKKLVTKRLEKLKLTTLLERRMKGDAIETFKIMEFLIIVDI